MSGMEEAGTAVLAPDARAQAVAAIRQQLPPAGYAVDIGGDGTGWVRVTGADAVLVPVEAGMAAGWTGVPEAIRHGIVMLAAHLFVARDSDAAPPAAVAALWRPYRRIALAGDRR